MNRKRLFEIIQIGRREDVPSKTFDFVIVAVILVNIAVLFLGTFSELSRFETLFDTIEIITVAVFIVEYALRIWTADLLYPELPRGQAILKFIFSFNGIVELFTILPFFFLTGFVVFRMLRVVRIFHLFRINATYDSFNVITQVLYEKRNQLISSIFIVLVFMMASSLCMYSVEHPVQPDVFKNAFSGMWWSLSTIFTVGYGDIYPVTALGRCMTVVITILGVGCVAIPTGIISAGFVEHYSRMRNKGLPDPSTRETVSLKLDKDSPMAGKTVDETERLYKVSISAVARGESIILPTDNLVLLEDDLIIYQSTDL
jgi:voltage-gated potassium channel